MCVFVRACEVAIHTAVASFMSHSLYRQTGECFEVGCKEYIAACF